MGIKVPIKNGGGIDVFESFQVIIKDLEKFNIRIVATLRGHVYSTQVPGTC